MSAAPRATATVVLALVAALCVALVPASSPAAVKRPAGTVKLAKKNLKKVGTVQCGKPKTTWLGGTKYKPRWFVSHLRQSQNFTKAAKKKSGATRTKLLKKAAKFKKLHKKQLPICKPKPSSNNVPPGTVPGGTGLQQGTGAPVKFSISNAAGLALKDPQAARTSRQAATTTGSNMAVVGADGTLKDAVTSGTVKIAQFLIAPNGKLYAALSGGTDLDGAGTSPPTCILAEVDVATGTPTCIDSTLTQMDVRTHIGGGPGQGTFKNPVVQFDSTGAILYTGATVDGKRVLRKYLNGVTTDLITDNVYLTDFLVRPDNSVIVTGGTASTGSQWTRRVLPSGGLENLKNDSAYWLGAFPDGNVYMGFNNSGFGVKRYVTGGPAEIEAKYWMANATRNGTDAYNDTNAFCSPSPGQFPPGSEICDGGNFVKYQFTTTDAKVYSVTMGSRGTSQLFEYFPGVAHVPSQITDIKVAQGVITNAVLSGLNAGGKNVTTVLNTSNGNETTIIPTNDEIEVYHVNYVANGNKVMFDGLRFSDNKYVIGQVSLSGGTISTVASGTVKWTDLQSFG